MNQRTMPYAIPRFGGSWPVSEQLGASNRREGIAFHTAMAHGRLTSSRLCQIVAQLLGRKGSLSGLSPDEIAALDKLLWELQCLLARLPKGNL